MKSIGFACNAGGKHYPIGISTVKLFGIKDSVVTVQGLDVIKGTPIFDLKPYTPQYDSVYDAKVPEWVNKLEY